MNTRSSTGYALAILIVGGALALFGSFLLGNLIGSLIAYSREYELLLSLSMALSALVLGVVVSAKMMGKKVALSAIVLIALALVVFAILLAFQIQRPSVWLMCLLLSVAAISTGWAAGKRSRCAYEDELREFHVRRYWENNQQKLRAAEDLALGQAAETFSSMPPHSQRAYELTVLDTLLNLSGVSRRNEAALPRVARVSGCSLPIAMVILKRFESQGWIKMTHEKERASWEDQIINVVGPGLREYSMSSNDKDNQRVPHQTFHFTGPVTAATVGHTAGNTSQYVAADEQGNQKNRGLDARDIVRLRKAFEDLAPDISEDTRHLASKELDDLDTPGKATRAIENLGKIFEGLGKVGEPLLKILTQFNT